MGKCENGESEANKGEAAASERKYLLSGSGKLAYDAASRIFVDFAMSRNRLQDSCDDIAIPVMVRSMTHKYSAVILNPANQVKVLHA